MQAVAPPPAPGLGVHCSPPEPLAAKLERLHADALDTLHKVMLKATESFINPAADHPDANGNPPAPPNPADHARTITQRMRLALSAARELLRHHAPGATPPPRSRTKPASTAPSASPQDSDAPPPTPKEPAQPASTILAAAGAAVSRFGERSALSTGAPEAPQASQGAADAPQAQSPTSSSELPPAAPLNAALSVSPHDTAPGAQPGPRPALVYPPRPSIFERYPEHKLPKIPDQFTDEEIDLFERTLRTADPFPRPLYNKLVAWRNHCGCYGFTHPLPVTFDLLQDRDPFRRKRAEAAAAQQSKTPTS